MLAAIILWCDAAHCQDIVIDPSQIAASAENTAEQIDYMIRQIGELTSLGDKVAGLRQYAEDSFGGDLAGAADLLRSLGTIDRLMKAYSERISLISEVSSQASLLSKEGITGTAALLELLQESVAQARHTIESCRKILLEKGFTKKEKKDMVEKLADDLEDGSRLLRESSGIETQIALNAKAIADLSNMVQKSITDHPRQVTTSARTPLTGTISIALMLCAAASLTWGYSRHCQGDDNVFIRIGAGVLVCVTVLGIISRVFGI